MNILNVSLKWYTICFEFPLPNGARIVGGDDHDTSNGKVGMDQVWRDFHQIPTGSPFSPTPFERVSKRVRRVDNYYGREKNIYE